VSKEHYYDIIKSPAITEKGRWPPSTTRSSSTWPRRATKPEIKKAVEGLFGVKVKAVNTLIRKGKQRRFKGQLALLSDVKKAYVTLEEGQRLDVTTGL
jgi:large subunit ribosomal protein L23